MHVYVVKQLVGPHLVDVDCQDLRVIWPDSSIHIVPAPQNLEFYPPELLHGFLNIAPLPPHLDHDLLNPRPTP